MLKRTVKITGKSSDIARSAQIIYQFLEDKAATSKKLDRVPEAIDYGKLNVKVRLLTKRQNLSSTTHFVTTLKIEKKCSI